MSETRLLPTDELLRSFVAEMTERRIRDHKMMQMIAELDRRGAATELGYRNLACVLRDAVRWDLNEARKWVANAALLNSEITPTGRRGSIPTASQDATCSTHPPNSCYPGHANWLTPAHSDAEGELRTAITRWRSRGVLKP